jgi:hypothetical protein
MPHYHPHHGKFLPLVQRTRLFKYIFSQSSQARPTSRRTRTVRRAFRVRVMVNSGSDVGMFIVPPLLSCQICLTIFYHRVEDLV